MLEFIKELEEDIYKCEDQYEILSLFKDYYNKRKTFEIKKSDDNDKQAQEKNIIDNFWDFNLLSSISELYLPGFDGQNSTVRSSNELKKINWQKLIAQAWKDFD